MDVFLIGPEVQDQVVVEVGVELSLEHHSKEAKGN
jgi:hypothetical protein